MTLTVLHVIPSFAGGGAEHQLVALAAGLSEAGVDVHVAYVHGGPNLEAAHRTGATLHRLSCAGNHDPRVALELCSLIREVRPAVVQTWLLHADVFGGIAARWCGVPWLLSERSSAVMYAHGMKFRLRRWLGRTADGIVANSEGGLQYWLDSGFRGAGCVIRNIVSAPPATPQVPTLVGAAGPTILAVGRMSPEKNYPLLLEALKLVFTRVPSATASILGEGPERVRLQAHIAASPELADRVTLPGHVGDVAKRLAGASVYVSLSRFEGAPNTVLEAIQQGCPLVLSDIPAHRELVSSDDARLVDLAHLASVVDAISGELLNPAAALLRAAQARARLGTWSAARIVAQYIDLYRELTLRRTVCASS